MDLALKTNQKCAPNFEFNNGSCFTKDALLKIIKAYNRHHMDKITYDDHDVKKNLWSKINIKLKEICGNRETCWLDQGFLQHTPELNDYFKPLAPLGQYQWLTTDDIYNVMSQWEKKYPDFKFVGPLPIDFLELTDNDSIFLKKLNLSKSPYRNIGVIFNLDPSTDGGSHWIAMNVNRKKGEIGFFDSYGDKHLYHNKYNLPFYNSFGQHSRGNKIPIPLEIQTLIHRFIKGNENYKLKVNTMRHQYANSECGIYSMLFLLKSLNTSFEKITQDIIADELANQYRTAFFKLS